MKLILKIDNYLLIYWINFNDELIIEINNLIIESTLKNWDNSW